MKPVLVTNAAMLNSVDWSMSIATLQKLYGFSKRFVIAERKRRGLPATPRRRMDWSKADRSWPASRIVEAVGCSESAAWRFKSTVAGFQTPENRTRSRVDWALVDWRATNTEIARQHAICHSEVARQRVRAGQPPSTVLRAAKPSDPWDLPLDQHLEGRVWIRIAAARGGLNYTEIGAIIGLTKQRIEQIASAALAKLKAQGVDWDLTADLREESQEFPTQSVDQAWMC